MIINFPSATVLRVTGRHAFKYLQNRLTNDLRPLIAGRGATLAAALTAQGKLQGLFTVLAEGENSYLLVAEGGDCTTLTKAVGQFKVAEQVDIQDCSEEFSLFQLDGLSADELSSTLPDLTTEPKQAEFLAAAGVIITPVRGLSNRAFLCLVPKEHATLFLSHARKVTPELCGDNLYTARVRRNLPSFPQELPEDILLSESGIDGAVSFTKGCYVGQEVIAKIDALGRSPRTLQRFYCPGKHLELSGAIVTREDDPASRPLGRILSSGFDVVQDETLGFVLIKNDPTLLDGPLFANGALAKGLAINILKDTA
jgi:folate-binding protein YgfZ